MAQWADDAAAVDAALQACPTSCIYFVDRDEARPTFCAPFASLFDNGSPTSLHVRGRLQDYGHTHSASLPRSSPPSIPQLPALEHVARATAKSRTMNTVRRAGLRPVFSSPCGLAP